MYGRRNRPVWWRGCIAAAMLLLGVLAPDAATFAAPDWQAGSICHAGSADAPHNHAPHNHAPGATAHIHCALCLIGQAACLPPLPPPLPLPGSAHIVRGGAFVALRQGSGTYRAYASRAPPAPG